MTDTGDTVRPARGRPRDPGKRDALLEAARRLFLDRGFESVTVEDVTAAAQVSRATFYANFPDKAALLEAIITNESNRIMAIVPQDGDPPEGLEASLRAYGVRLLTFLSDPDMIAMERLVASVRRSGSDLVHRLYAAGPGRNIGRLAAMMEAAQRDGVLAPGDVRTFVSDLVGLWQGFMRVELTFAQRGTPGRDELQAMAAHGVRQFMRLHSLPKFPELGRMEMDLPDAGV